MRNYFSDGSLEGVYRSRSTVPLQNMADDHRTSLTSSLHLLRSRGENWSNDWWAQTRQNSVQVSIGNLRRRNPPLDSKAISRKPGPC